MIQNIVYISRSTKNLSKQEIKELIFRARVKNREQKITGFLIHKDDFFMQWIEGPSENIDELLIKLRKDDRHRDLKVIMNRSIDRSIFGNWRMLYFPEIKMFNTSDFEKFYGDTNEVDVLKFVDKIEFDSLSLIDHKKWYVA